MIEMNAYVRKRVSRRNTNIQSLPPRGSPCNRCGGEETPHPHGCDMDVENRHALKYYCAANIRTFFYKQTYFGCFFSQNSLNL